MPANRQRLIENFGKLPLSFEANRGQVDAKVRFLSRGQGYTLALTNTEAVLSIPPSKGVQCGVVSNHGPVALVPHSPRASEFFPEVIRVRLVGSNPAPGVSGRDRLPGTANYFLGNNPTKWRTGIPTYAQVRYEGVYPGIDLVYYGNQRQLEYDFVVSPGADLHAIGLQIETGNSKLENRNSKIAIDHNGDLVIETAGGQVRFHKPTVYQVEQSSRSSVVGGQLRNSNGEGQRATGALRNSEFTIQNSQFLDGHYLLTSHNRVHFEIADYDRTKPLMIDPVITSSTYLGGTSFDQANGIALDGAGNIYLAGFTQSSNYPTVPGSLDTSYGGVSDVFVTKLSPNGTSLLYSTYLGGSGAEHASGIAVNSAGNTYIAGQTLSGNFPTTPGAFMTTYGGNGDAFIAALSPDGSSLLYSTYFGGSQIEEARGIALDLSDNAYLTGLTYSSDFPTLGALQPSLKGEENAFVAEFNNSGTLVYSTYFGGSGRDVGKGIAVDSAGDAYLTGSTTSPDFPVTNPLQATCKSCPSINDAFVTEIAANGAGLVYSTFLGGSQDDQGLAIAVDGQGNAYVTGQTFSSDFPSSSGAYQKSLVGGSSAFVAMIAAGGSGLGYSTYLGSDDYTMGRGIAILNGNAYITGITHASKFPVVNPTQSTLAGLPDAFVSELNTTGSSLYLSTYLGGSNFDEGNGIALDSLGNAYVSGHSRSSDFPLKGAIQGTYGGGDSDVFVVKIHVPPLTISPTSLTFADQIVGTKSGGQKVTVTNNGKLSLLVNGVTFTGADASDFAADNGCTNKSLGAGANCSFNITFSPNTTGTLTATANVAANASGSPPQTVALMGTGTAPVATLSPASLSFGDQLVGITSAAQTVTLSNTGNAKLNGINISVTGTNANQFQQSNNCGSSVAAGANCQINVTFKPSITGPLSASVTIKDNATDSPQSVPLSGNGVSSQISLSPGTVSFDSQQVGTTSSAQNVTLSNPTSTAVTISSIAISGGNNTSFAQTNNCGTALAAGSSCAINVTFTPTTTGNLSSTLLVSDNSANSPQKATLTGTGAVAAASASPSTLQFGNQAVNTTSAAQAVTLSNPGSLVLSNIKISITGANANQFSQTNNCGTSIPAASNCTINVSFKPTAVANLSATLTITDNAVNSPQTVSLAGAGVNPGAYASPTSLSFGSQVVGTTSAPQAVTLSYVAGSGSILISSVAISGTNAGDFGQTNNCGTGLAAGANCTINVTFTPTAAGTRSAVLTISDSATNSPQAVSLTGTATAASAGLSPTSLTFASQGVGTTSAAQMVTLSNTGSVALSISSIAITGTNSGDFAQTNNCGTSVAAGANCTINVTFTPAVAGTRTASLAVTDNAGNSPQTASLTGTGASSTPPVTLSPASLTFSSQNVNTTSAPQGVTLTNSQSTMLSISSIAITGTNSGDFAQTNNCGASLAANTSCTINVTFTPAATGTRTASLNVTDNASNSPQTASLAGTGSSSTSSGPALVQVQNNIDTSGSAFTSFSANIATTPGDLLVAFCRESSNATDNFTVTDSAGQTWTQTASGYANISGTGPRSGMFYIANSAAVTNVTVNFTTTGGAIKPGIMVMEISGAASSAVADGSVNSASGASVTTSTSGSLSTTNANDILIFATDTGGNESTWTAGTGYAIPNNKLIAGASGSNVRMAMQYAVVSSTEVNTATSMTYSGSNWNGNIFAAFK